MRFQLLLDSVVVMTGPGPRPCHPWLGPVGGGGCGRKARSGGHHQRDRLVRDARSVLQIRLLCVGRRSWATLPPLGLSRRRRCDDFTNLIIY